MAFLYEVVVSFCLEYKAKTNTFSVVLLVTYDIFLQVTFVSILVNCRSIVRQLQIYTTRQLRVNRGINETERNSSLEFILAAFTLFSIRVRRSRIVERLSNFRLLTTSYFVDKLLIN